MAGGTVQRQVNGTDERPSFDVAPAGSDGPPRPARRPAFWRWLLVVGVVLVLGSGLRLVQPIVHALRGGPAADAAVDVPDVPPPVPVAMPPVPRSGRPLAVRQRPVVVVNNPSRLRIPRIGVDAPIIHLGLNPDGTIGVPKAWGDVGWYDRGPVPGSIGPAVLVGHYDSTTGPAVFYRLRELVPGDRIEVAAPTGVSQTFAVDRTENVAKSTFPTNRVYGPVNLPELRLITCGGAFNEKTKHYVNNLVVYAHAETFEETAPIPAGGAGVPAPSPAAPAGASASGGPAPTPAAAARTAPAAVPPAGGGPPAVPPAASHPAAGGRPPVPPPAVAGRTAPVPVAPIPARPHPAAPIPATHAPATPVPAAHVPAVPIPQRSP